MYPMRTFAPQYYGVLPNLLALHTKVKWFRSHALIDGLSVQDSVGQCSDSVSVHSS